jgi:hypothetical protein
MKHTWHLYITEPSGVKKHLAKDTLQNIFKRIKNYFNHVQSIQENSNTKPTIPRTTDKKTGRNALGYSRKNSAM